MNIRYFGWSGILLQYRNVEIGFDLFGEEVTWQALNEGETLALCLTHGHPEHCGSMRHFLSSPGGAHGQLTATHLISSQNVIKYIVKGVSIPPQNVHGIQADERVSIGGASITAFSWIHMPLLPPSIHEKVDYIRQVLSHPVALFRIGFGNLGLPLWAPMLGFHVAFPDGRTILNYAEGLHRLTDPDEVEFVASTYHGETLMFAVEPEDVDAIPRWLKILNPHTVILYEAHRPWRELFSLPYVDLSVYANELSAQFLQMQVKVLHSPGQYIAL